MSVDGDDNLVRSSACRNRFLASDESPGDRILSGWEEAEFINPRRLLSSVVDDEETEFLVFVIVCFVVRTHG